MPGTTQQTPDPPNQPTSEENQRVYDEAMERATALRQQLDEFTVKSKQGQIVEPHESDPLVPCLKATDRVMREFRRIIANPSKKEQLEICSPALDASLSLLSDAWGECSDESNA